MQGYPHREPLGRCCWADRGLLVRAKSITRCQCYDGACCCNHIIRAQADRPVRIAGHARQDRERTPSPRRRHSPAYPPRRIHHHLRHHATRHNHTSWRHHVLPHRLQHQDDDRRAHPATGSGEQAHPQRSCLEVRPARAQWRQDHHRRAARDAQRPLQLLQRSRNIGEHGPTPS